MSAFVTVVMICIEDYTKSKHVHANCCLLFLQLLIQYSELFILVGMDFSWISFDG